ncbi:hypothetical protein cypCar_00032962, partial [Cyprinus carpio]
LVFRSGALPEVIDNIAPDWLNDLKEAVSQSMWFNHEQWCWGLATRSHLRRERPSVAQGGRRGPNSLWSGREDPGFINGSGLCVYGSRLIYHELLHVQRFALSFAFLAVSLVKVFAPYTPGGSGIT